MTVEDITVKVIKKVKRKSKFSVQFKTFRFYISFCNILVITYLFCLFLFLVLHKTDFLKQLFSKTPNVSFLGQVSAI